MDKKENINLSLQRLERAKDDLRMAELLYNNNELLGANNRAYYSIFHSMRAILALERVDFKRHKDVQAYFNQNYVRTQKFPKKIGHKIAIASRIREDSDYDDNFIKNEDDTKEQIETARELIKLVEEWIDRN